MVHFVGAGSGAPDLITLRGKKFLEEADVVIYAGSLVNPQLLEYTKENCEIYNSAKMTLEEVLEVMKKADREQKMTVRLHTGDPCLYGAIREQMDHLDELGIAYDSCPGASSFCGAAAALGSRWQGFRICTAAILLRGSCFAARRNCRPSAAGTASPPTVPLKRSIEQGVHHAAGT